MKKIEANEAYGIEFVEDFDAETKVYNGNGNSVLTVQDFIADLGRHFDGTIGWIATEDDIEAIREAGFSC